MSNTKIRHFEANRQGRDFVLGDLHGCFDEFVTLLDYVNFDKAVDRVFSVGDLIDRGPKSFECAHLIDYPWFHAVQGNHEDFMIQALVHFDQNAALNWAFNGGDWVQKMQSHGEQTLVNDALFDLAQKLERLPLVITVGDTVEERFNVVHAEMYHEIEIFDAAKEMHSTLGMLFGPKKRVPLTNAMIDDWVFNYNEEVALLWGRSIVSGKVANELWHDPKEMSLTFCGHTPLQEVLQFGQQMFIDCGAVFHYRGNKHSDRALILAEPAAKQYHRYGMLSHVTNTHSFDSVEKWAQ